MGTGRAPIGARDAGPAGSRAGDRSDRHPGMGGGDAQKIKKFYIELIFGLTSKVPFIFY